MKQLIIALIICLVAMSGCEKAKAPITLTMWHNFGSSMQHTIDELANEFNSTVGKEQGIIINIEAVTSSAELRNALDMVLNEDPAAPKMPDILVAYPAVAAQFQNKGLLARLDKYFSQEELDAYMPAFIAEGFLADGGLYVFPFAKSTEVLFVNKTLFDRFSEETGASIDELASIEGLADVAMRYYKWTGGKQFFAANAWVNLAQTAMLQQGASLFIDEKLTLDNTEYKKIWANVYNPVVNGGFNMFAGFDSVEGYASDDLRTGNILAAIGSSAGAVYNGDTVHYPDGTSEKVEFIALPHPVMKGGKKIAVQRGGGLIVAKSETAREAAAATFLKWFTQPKQNIRFVSQTGYMPTMREAFDSYTSATEHTSYTKHVFSAMMTMNSEYRFFLQPSFNTFDAISKKYELQFKTVIHEQAAKGATAAEALDEFMAVMVE